MLHPSGHPSAFCDIRYNITYQTFNWLQHSQRHRRLSQLAHGEQPLRWRARQAVPPTSLRIREFATDAAAGLGNAAAGDAGGAI